MAEATRREVPRRSPPAPPKAKTLGPTDPGGVYEPRADKRPTARPPARPSGLDPSEVRPYRPRADSGICLGEEVVADLSKDPRHDDG